MDWLDKSKYKDIIYIASIANLLKAQRSGQLLVSSCSATGIFFEQSKSSKIRAKTLILLLFSFSILLNCLIYIYKNTTFFAFIGYFHAIVYKILSLFRLLLSLLLLMFLVKANFYVITQWMENTPWRLIFLMCVMYFRF